MISRGDFLFAEICAHIRSKTRIRVFLARRTNTHVQCTFCVSATGSTPTSPAIRRSARSLASSISLDHAVSSSDPEDSSAMEDIPCLTCLLHTFFLIPTRPSHESHDGDGGGGGGVGDGTDGGGDDSDSLVGTAVYAASRRSLP